MNSLGFESSDIDFRESQISQLSKYDFQIKNQTFQGYQTNKSIIDACDSQKQYSDTPQACKKLYIKDLQSHKDNSQKIKMSGKQNNIPNQPSDYTQSRKIIIHKNTSISPYRNSQNIDESFTTNKIVQLQEQMIQLRKEMSLKQSSWIKQKSILINKIQIANFDVAQMKQRNNNLIQINQTLTQALGQTTKNSISSQYERKIQDMNKQIQQKSKKIQSFEEIISKLQKQKGQISSKLKQQKQKAQYLTKNLEEYKFLVKQSSQRKFESDERIVLWNKNMQILKKKLNELPIKNEYLNPIYGFLNMIKQGNNNCIQNEQGQDLQISQIKKQNQSRFSRGQRVKYRQQQDYVKLDNKNNYLSQDNNDNYYNDESQYSRQNEYQNQNQIHNKQYFNKVNKKQKNKMKFGNYVKRIDTQQNQYEQVQDIEYQEYQQQQQKLYRCERCQKALPQDKFISHMKTCKQYEDLIKQKKAIQYQLISIQDQQYQKKQSQNRKSNFNSLNSSAIIMNKSKSKHKIIKPSENNIKTNRNYLKQSHQTGTHTNRNNGGRTQRYIHKDQSHQNSRIQLSQLMNISGISNRPSNTHGQRTKTKHGLINPSNYFTSQIQNQQNTNYRVNQQNINYRFNQQNMNYKYKANPQIKYQTNIPNINNSNNNIGKQSMQQQIRKIVQALNEGNKQKSRNDSYIKKQNQNQSKNQSNKKQFMKINRNKPQFY